MKKSELRKIIKEEINFLFEDGQRTFAEGLKAAKKELSDAIFSLRYALGATYTDGSLYKYKKSLRQAINKVADARSVVNKLGK